MMLLKILNLGKQFLQIFSKKIFIIIEPVYLFHAKIKKVYIAYGESSFNLKGYDITKNEKFTIYEKLHENNFDSLRHFYDKNKDRDLLITASLDSHVKVIEFKREKSEKIIDLNFQSENKVIINTSYFINDMILVPFSNNKDGKVKFYNMNEEYISELQNLGFILGLNVYNNYILIANTVGIFSYDFENSSFKRFVPKKITPQEKDDNGFDEPYIIQKGQRSLLLGPCFYYPYLIKHENEKYLLTSNLKGNLDLYSYD